MTEQDFEQIMHDEEHKQDQEDERKRKFHEGRVEYFKLIDKLKQKGDKK